MDTETIDRLFLELSQVTKATTARELALQAENARLAAENARLREAMPSDAVWLDVRHALTVFEPEDDVSRWVQRLDAARPSDMRPVTTSEAAASFLDSEAFISAARPLIRWLNENTNPHAQVIVTTTSAELVEGALIVHDESFARLDAARAATGGDHG